MAGKSAREEAVERAAKARERALEWLKKNAPEVGWLVPTSVWKGLLPQGGGVEETQAAFRDWIPPGSRVVGVEFAGSQMIFTLGPAQPAQQKEPPVA